MRKKTLKNFLSFLLVLVLTVCTVAALSMVTRAQTDPALPAVEESIPVAELSASVPQQPMVASPWVCVGAFLLMMLLVASRFGLLSQGKEPRKPWLPGQAQLRAAGGHGVSWQESSIRVFVLSYFTSEQGRHFLPVLFSFPAF